MSGQKRGVTTARRWWGGTPGTGVRFPPIVTSLPLHALTGRATLV
jgi:hypothetical protein